MPIQNPEPEGTFGRQLNEMRQALDLTLDGLAWSLELRVHHTLISHWEHNRKMPTRRQLLALVKFFAGKTGCLEKPRDAQEWVRLLAVERQGAGERVRPLTEGQLREYFRGASDAEIREALDLARDRWPGQAGPCTPPPPTPEQLTAYLDVVVRAYRYWRERYVPQEADRLRDGAPALPPGDFPFVERECEHVVERAGLETREPLDEPLLDWLLKRRTMALLAVPGCGKSTAFEEIALEMAERQRGVPPEQIVLPVLLPLGVLDEGMTWRQFVPKALLEALTRALVRYGWKEWSAFETDPQAAETWYRRQVVGPAVEALADHFEAMRDGGRLLVLLDGLNELRGGAEGPLRGAVEEFVEKCQEAGNPVAVACRRENYTRRIASLNRVELKPFDDERVRRGLRGYLGEAQGNWLWAQLQRPENGQIRKMLSIPLYISVLGTGGVVERDAQGRPCLPANRGAMLDRFARGALDVEWHKAGRASRPLAPTDVQLEALGETAFRMRAEGGSRGGGVPWPLAYGFLAAALAGQPYRPEAVRDLAAGAGLIEPTTGGRFAFRVEPLEECFAARGVLARFARGDLAACQELWRPDWEVAPARVRSPGEPPEYPQTAGAWEQTTILAAGLAGTAVETVAADDFIAAVLAVNPGLAGRCLHEGGARAGAETASAVRARLREVMEAAGRPVRERVPCGVLLGRLGDPRFHGADLYGLPDEPLLGFIEVPPGPFRMGSDRGTMRALRRWAQQNNFPPDWFDDEAERGRAEIPYAYWIARYPVTNAQFRCFVRDGGYTEERWRGCWTEAGRRWLLGERFPEELNRVWENYYNGARNEYQEYETYAGFREGALLPSLARLRKDTEEDPYWLDDRYNAPNQPVVGVTWYEAHAYARWLTARLSDDPAAPGRLRDLLAGGYAVRLPSEAEWERAARGGLRIPDGCGRLVRNPRPARRWPWGDDWDPRRCNAADPQGDEPVLWLSPAGMYLEGASPYGCLDMAGNVWEWTRSVYGPYPYPTTGAGAREREDEDSTDFRVVRGGSWRSTRGRALRVPGRGHPIRSGRPSGVSGGMRPRLVLNAGLLAAGFCKGGGSGRGAGPPPRRAPAGPPPACEGRRPARPSEHNAP